MQLNQLLSQHGKKVGSLLDDHGFKIVLAESCSGGMIASTLSSLPGTSNRFCGSTVVYRYDTKTRWLKLPKKFVKEQGAVGALLTLKLAQSVLKKTPEADLALAVAGHLGPNAPQDKDGIVDFAVVFRKKHRFVPMRIKSLKLHHTENIFSMTVDLNSFDSSLVLPRTYRGAKSAEILRLKRQMATSYLGLLMVQTLLKGLQKEKK